MYRIKSNFREFANAIDNNRNEYEGVSGDLLDKYTRMSFAIDGMLADDEFVGCVFPEDKDYLVSSTYIEEVEPKRGVPFFSQVLLDKQVEALNLEMVKLYVLQANTKHPRWPSSILIQGAIIAEEAGEVIKEALNFTECHSVDEMLIIKSKMTTEVYQTLAVCIRYLQNLKGEDDGSVE